MKIFFRVLILLVFLTGLNTHAQSRIRANDGQILDRSIGASQRYNTPKKAKKVDFVKPILDNLTDKLKLDGFQNAILNKILIDYNEIVTAIDEENIPQEAKIEKINIEKATLDEKITNILTEQQKTSFIELKKSNKNTNKSKSKKKKKNKKSDSTESADSEEDLF